MNLYLIAGRYVGTQADARAAAREAGIKFDPEKHSEEVPTDKARLIAYLNRLTAKPEPAPRIAMPAGIASMSVTMKPGAPPLERDMSAGAILDRIDRQHAEQALKEARAAIESGLNLIKRKHSGEPERIDEAEAMLED